MAWSIEAKMRNRRKRKARRLWKQQPLFAFELMVREFPCYTPEAFTMDLATSKDKKYKSKKSPLVRYGRYREMQRLLGQWELNRDPALGLEILRLRRNMTRPYKLTAVFGRERWCFEYPATFPIATLKELVTAAKASKTLNEYREREKGITRFIGFGN